MSNGRCFSSYYFFIEIHLLPAHSIYPDQTSHSAASDLGLFCLPMCLLWDNRHKWVTADTVSATHYCSVGTVVPSHMLISDSTQKTIYK